MRHVRECRHGARRAGHLLNDLRHLRSRRAPSDCQPKDINISRLDSNLNYSMFLGDLCPHKTFHPTGNLSLHVLGFCI